MLHTLAVSVAAATLLLIAQSLPAAPVAHAATASTGTGSLAGDFLVASTAQRHGDWSSAAAYYLHALNSAPQIDALRSRAIVAALMAGEVDAALARARDPGLTLGPGPTAMLSLARAVHALRAGRYQEAAQAAEGLNGLPLEREMSNALRIIAYTAAGEAGRAEPLLQALRGQGEHSSFVTMLQAMLADLGGNMAEAARLYGEVDAATPTIRSSIGYMSALSRSGGDQAALTRAIESFAQSQGEALLGQELVERARAGRLAPLVSSPADVAAEVMYDLAMGLRSQAADLGVLLARMSLHLRPGQPLVTMALAEIAEERDRPDLAGELYAQAVQQAGPETALGWLLRQKRAGALYQAEKIDAAITDLRAMAAERPDRADIYVQIGNMLRWQSRFADSLAAYDKALSIVNDDWRLFYYRGISRHETDNWAGAEADLIRALELRADDPLVLNFLGYSWIERGQNLDRAKGMIEKAVSLRPQDGFITDSLGWAYYQLADYPRAVEYLERAVELEPYDPVINDHLGDAYWRVGRLNEARFQWRRAINESKDAKLTEAARDKLENGLDG